MKNTLNVSISVLAVSIFIMIAPTTEGMHPMAPEKNPGRTEIMPAITVMQKPMMLAENEKNTAGQTAAGTKDPESEAQSGPETDDKEQPNEPKTAPLKPFRPSEEIAAEQAVDFPVDI